MKSPPRHSIAHAASLVADASSILFITGAGISVECGLPTYRGLGGLHTDAQGQEDAALTDRLSRETFLRDPETTLATLAPLQRLAAQSPPGLSHQILARLEKNKARTWLLTQNIDGLHGLAGSKNLIEIHGNIHRSRCDHCHHVLDAPLRIDGCPRCQNPLRPDVVLFGEALPFEPLSRLQRELRHGFDLIMVIGTSAAFPYIADPIVRAARQGSPTIEINPTPTDISHFVACHLKQDARSALQGIATQLKLR